ncbi:MAG TPA: hypothetical protein VHD91_01905 [Gaiellaceae bacterium]|nr:hypothetical protein [Gaiellaceae bacterium]
MQILRKYPNAKLHVFAVWENALVTDSRGAWSKYMFGDDPRVTSIWDGTNQVGQWYVQHGYGFGGIDLTFIYDAYFAYGSKDVWKDDTPTSPIVDGSEIITHTDGLQQKFAPLLG